MTHDDAAQKTMLKLIEDGVSASAEVLAEVSKTRWLTQTVSVSADGMDRIRARLASDPKEYYGAYITMPGAVFLLMLPHDRGAALAKAFLGGRGARPGAALPRASECVAEIANIVLHAVVKALADACEEPFLLSAPEMVRGKKTGLLTLALDKIESGGESFGVMTYVHMSSDKLSSDCTMLLFLGPSRRGMILKALA